MKKIFQYQLWHLLALLGLLATLRSLFVGISAMRDGDLWGITTQSWFWIAVFVPVVHQVYVWLIWRLELYRRTFSSRFGWQPAFRAYAAGFSLLFGGRLVVIILLAMSNQGSLAVDQRLTFLLTALITPLVVYLFYSVKRYFTVERAYGIDHFDKDYKEPYVKGGIFRYTSNGMYVFGLMILYIPGLLLLSKAALLAALFNHVYIWVHYYCTELPDMQFIYKPQKTTPL